MIALTKACLLFSIYLFVYFIGRHDGEKIYYNRCKGEIDKWDM